MVLCVKHTQLLAERNYTVIFFAVKRYIYIVKQPVKQNRTIMNILKAKHVPARTLFMVNPEFP